MHVLFNAAMRWELIPYQHNPMSLVRVKDSSKRLKERKFLTAQEFCALLEHIPEPFRTMCIVAMCLDCGQVKFSVSNGRTSTGTERGSQFAKLTFTVGRAS
jgi:integrase